jgi:hypothetical protein
MKNKAREQYDALNEFLTLPPYEEWVWTEWVVRKPYVAKWIEGLPF